MERAFPPCLLLAAALGAPVIGGCSGDDSSAVPPRHPSPRCTRDDEAPVPDGFGDVRCVRVGADLARVPGDRPDPRAADPSLPEPVRWVVAGAAPGGDGSRDRPFANVLDALASLPSSGGTLALSAGHHTLGGPIVLRSPLAVVGVGAADTVLTAPAIVDGFNVVATRLTLARLAIEHIDIAPPPNVTSVEASSGARVSLRDVVVRRATRAIRATGEGTRVVAEGLTVRNARGHGVTLLNGARGTFRRLLVRDGAFAGVYAGVTTDRMMDAIGGRLQIVDGLLASNRGGGIVLVNDPTPTGGADCDATDLAASEGSFDCLVGVAVQGNDATGVFVSGRRALSARRLHVGATRSTAANNGDGLYATRGARVRLDERLRGDVEQGRGSRFLSNDRAGVLVDQPMTELTVHGALVGSNRGPGVLLQSSARAMEVHYSVVSDNTGLGLGLTPDASVASILCDQFVYTRDGALVTTRGTVTVGDAVSMYGASVGTVEGNVLSHNARFALLLAGTRGDGGMSAVVRRNRGEDNLYGVGAYDGAAVMIENPEAIRGRAASPATTPAVASAQPVGSM